MFGFRRKSLEDRIMQRNHERASTASTRTKTHSMRENRADPRVEKKDIGAERR